MPNVLYGAAYYNEYMPADLQPGRLEKDVALMQQAGISVVRMGESTWSLWEPSDGTFDYAWMDRIVAAMSKANIKVILGTPTYSIPVWMWKAHPEMLARPLGGGAVGYGMRQNMNTDDPNYRRYAERLIVNLVEHYRKNPAVIGWQIDNETAIERRLQSPGLRWSSWNASSTSLELRMPSTRRGFSTTGVRMSPIGATCLRATTLPVPAISWSGHASSRIE